MFSSEPLTRKPHSHNSAATDPIAVPQIPRKWNFRGASLVTRIPYAAPTSLATETKLTSAQKLRPRSRFRLADSARSRARARDASWPARPPDKIRESVRKEPAPGRNCAREKFGCLPRTIPAVAKNQDRHRRHAPRPVRIFRPVEVFL